MNVLHLQVGSKTPPFSIYWDKEEGKWKEENITNDGKDNKATHWINGKKREEKYLDNLKTSI
jgi:hypothetical protein